MHQIQVNIFRSERVERIVNGFHRFFIARLLYVGLGGDEKFFPCDPRFFDRRTDCALVAVGIRRIEQAVAALDRIGYGVLADGEVVHLKHAEAFQGHFYAVLQRQVLHRFSLLSSQIAFEKPLDFTERNFGCIVV